MEIIGQYLISFFLVASTGTLLYLSLQGVSRMEDSSSDGKQGSLWERWTRSGLPEKIDAALNRSLHRLLRRLKVGMLKADNQITFWLKQTRTDDTEEDDRIDFKSSIFDKK